MKHHSTNIDQSSCNSAPLPCTTQARSRTSSDVSAHHSTWTYKPCTTCWHSHRAPHHQLLVRDLCAPNPSLSAAQCCWGGPQILRKQESLFEIQQLKAAQSIHALKYFNGMRDGIIFSGSRRATQIPWKRQNATNTAGNIPYFLDIIIWREHEPAPITCLSYRRIPNNFLSKIALSRAWFSPFLHYESICQD